MANENDLIRRGDLEEELKSLTGMFTDELGFVVELEAVLRKVEAAKSVDAVELPKVGKIGECVLWKPDSFEAMSVIEAIAVTDKGMRYCFRWQSVPVDSPKILQIMSQEEAERWLEDVYREKID